MQDSLVLPGGSSAETSAESLIAGERVNNRLMWRHSRFDFTAGQEWIKMAELSLNGGRK